MEDVIIDINTTGLALGDDFFKGKSIEEINNLIFEPILKSLFAASNGSIKEPGIYCVNLIIKKIK